MSASVVPAWQVQQFASNIMLLSQQKGSKIAPYVTQGSYKGNKANPVNQIGSVEMQPVTARREPISFTDASVTRRWVLPSDFDLAQIVDEFDKLRLLTDPTSEEVQAAVYAAGRRKDRLILAALNGTNQIGETGTGTIAFPAAQDVTISFEAGGSVGMTVAKLRRARKLLLAGNVDLDDPMNKAAFIHNSKAHDDLLKEAQVISLDFNDRPVLVDGQIRRFMGFDFVSTELIEASSTTDFNWVLCKSGAHLGVWQDIVTDLSRRNDIKGLPYQAYVKMSMGATRIEEAKVVRIQCLNT